MIFATFSHNTDYQQITHINYRNGSSHVKLLPDNFVVIGLFLYIGCSPADAGFLNVSGGKEVYQGALDGGLDVLLQHRRGGVAGDLHDVIQIHAGQIHQRSTGTTCRVGMDEFVLLDLYLLSQPGYLSDFLDVAVDDLVHRPRCPNNSSRVPNTTQTTARRVNCGL